MGTGRSRRGMSLLLEVVLGLGIFAGALLLMFSIFPTVHRSLTEAKNYRTASAIAASFAEREMLQSYSPIPAPQVFPYPVVSVLDGKSVTTNFTVNITRQAFETGLATEYQSIQVRVQWSEGAIAREVFYETFKVR